VHNVTWIQPGGDNERKTLVGFYSHLPSDINKVVKNIKLLMGWTSTGTLIKLLLLLDLLFKKVLSKTILAKF